MNVQDLINNYQNKISEKNKAVANIRQMIRNAKNGTTSSDIEDLIEEKLNAQRDIHLYMLFIKDLKGLIRR
jgi:hypothetical protein